MLVKCGAREVAVHVESRESRSVACILTVVTEIKVTGH